MLPDGGGGYSGEWEEGFQHGKVGGRGSVTTGTGSCRVHLRHL